LGCGVLVFSWIVPNHTEENGARNVLAGMFAGHDVREICIATYPIKIRTGLTQDGQSHRIVERCETRGARPFRRAADRSDDIARSGFSMAAGGSRASWVE